MKKVVLSVMAALVFFGAGAGTVFAETHLEKTVNSLVGVKYQWGGTSPKGFDCSGFTQYVFAQFNIELVHSSKGQAQKGYWIPKDELRLGDLVFFNTDGKGISHVGIYLGDDVFVHADSSKGVIKSRLSEEYYAKRYVTARRVTWQAVYEQMTAEVKPANPSNGKN